MPSASERDDQATGHSYANPLAHAKLGVHLMTRQAPTLAIPGADMAGYLDRRRRMHHPRLRHTAAVSPGGLAVSMCAARLAAGAYSEGGAAHADRQRAASTQVGKRPQQL